MTLERPWTGNWKSLEGVPKEPEVELERPLSVIYTSVYPNRGAVAGADDDPRGEGLAGGRRQGRSISHFRRMEAMSTKQNKQVSYLQNYYMKTVSEDVANVNNSEEAMIQVIYLPPGHRSLLQTLNNISRFFFHAPSARVTIPRGCLPAYPKRTHAREGNAALHMSV